MKRVTNKQSATAEKPTLALTDAFEQFGEAIAVVIAHPSCPPPIADALGRFTGDIISEVSIDGDVGSAFRAIMSKLSPQDPLPIMVAAAAMLVVPPALNAWTHRLAEESA